MASLLALARIAVAGASALAMRPGLLEAHISHVQFGDPAHQRPKPAEVGLD